MKTVQLQLIGGPGDGEILTISGSVISYGYVEIPVANKDQTLLEMAYNPSCLESGFRTARYRLMKQEVPLGWTVVGVYER